MNSPGNSEKKVLRSAGSKNPPGVPATEGCFEPETGGIGQSISSVLEHFSDGFIAMDQEWRIVYVNRRGKDVLRRWTATGSDLLGARFWDACPAVAGTTLERSFRRALQKQTAVRFEYFHPALDAWFDVRVHPSAEGVSVYFQDVTGQKRSQHRLKSSFSEIGDLKAALDEHAIVAITDPGGKILSVNDKFCAISKYTREELVGRDHRIINSGHHSTEFIRDLWSTISVGRVWKGEIKNKAKDGSFYWVDTTIVPFLDERGKPRQYVAIRADITQRKKAEEELKGSFKEIGDLKAALDEHAIVAITDPRGRIVFVNDKFCAISKYSREELIGQDHRIINSGHHPKKFIRELWTTIGAGKVWKGEIKNKAKDGSFYWVDTTIVPFLDEQGKPRHYVAIRADITERKRVEEQIHTLNFELEQRVQERTAQFEVVNKELEAFSYSVSHDLRAPLRHIGGFVNLLKESAGDALPERSRRHLETIADSARQMGRLIDDLLIFSRMGRTALNKEPVNLEELLNETLRALEPDVADRNIRWHRRPLPTVLGDRAMLRQVFTNLLANSVKYTRPRDPAEIEIGADHDGRGEVVICIRDNGVGFDMEYAAKLFGVFQRLHSDDEFEGTGIGLANVRRIIARHGGRTWAEGEVDAGATFYFSLPHTTIEQS